MLSIRNFQLSLWHLYAMVQGFHQMIFFQFYPDVFPLDIHSNAWRLGLLVFQECHK